MNTQQQQLLKKTLYASILNILASGTIHAGGFSLYTESSVTALGNYAAGSAAEASDASTGWYNPAGLALLHKQEAILGGIGVFPISKISGTSTFSVASPFPIPDYVQTFNGLNGGQSAFVPSFHYALPLGEHTTFGLSIVSPYGLSTDWGASSPVRYQATFTELITSNVSPEIGGQLSEHFNVGAGFDLQMARVKFNRILGVPTLFNIFPPFDPMAVDSLSYNKGYSFGVGFHAGILGVFNEEHTRLGLNYQSKIRHNFHGYSQLSGILANSVPSLAANTLPGPAEFHSNSLASNHIDLPEVITLSAYQDLNETVSLLGSLVYTGWDSFKTIQLNNVAAPSIDPLTLGVSQAIVNSASPQNYRNTWRAAIGANYQINPLWMLRVGGGYDQTPTNDRDRDVRLPDTDRWALSVGSHWHLRDNIDIDLGYTHLFAAKALSINRTDALGPTSAYNVTATGTNHADLVGAQLVWIIDTVKETK